ncbi:MAG: glycosyltransferase [Xenococcaceae cyanobacterium MO_188.B32]|nr:glycosyltransferase [Xenococcaceae cyanobacterium MO_188.B32]
MTKIDLIFLDGGGGHRSTATALHEIIKKKKSTWQPRLVNIQEIDTIKDFDIFYKMTGLPVTDIYNLMLKRGWTFLFPLIMTLGKLNLRHKSSELIALFERHWLKTQPDVVLSCIPNLNKILRESLQKAIPTTTFGTILTDFADCPPNYWIEQQEQFLICPTERAVKQARALGHQEEQIFLTSGLVINPRFYDPITVDRRIERESLGLVPDLPTGLVLFGGYGSTVMIKIARCLERSALNLQLIFLCGRNEKLAKLLRLSQNRLPWFVETFTNQIPYYMHLSDFFIGKPGPGSISEALAMNLPVITECNSSTMLQEKYSAEWIDKNEVGIVVRNFQNIDQAVAKLISSETLSRYRANIAAIQNKAVFEVLNILEKILDSKSI